MTLGKVFLAGLAAAVLILASDGDGFAEKFQKLSKAVQETANAHMGEAIPAKAASSQHGEGWDYQINTRLNGKMHNLVIDEKGAQVSYGAITKDEARGTVSEIRVGLDGTVKAKKGD